MLATEIDNARRDAENGPCFNPSFTRNTSHSPFTETHRASLALDDNIAAGRQSIRCELSTRLFCAPPVAASRSAHNAARTDCRTSCRPSRTRGPTASCRRDGHGIFDYRAQLRTGARAWNSHGPAGRSLRPALRLVPPEAEPAAPAAAVAGGEIDTLASPSRGDADDACLAVALEMPVTVFFYQMFMASCRYVVIKKKSTVLCLCIL